VATGQHLKVLTGHTAAVARLVFNHDSAMLASLSDDRTAIVRDVATGRARETLRGHGVAFSPDGRTLYTCSFDGSVFVCPPCPDRTAALWDTRSGEQVGAPLTSTLLVEQPNQWPAAALDATGHTLAMALNNTVLLWDVDPASWFKRACTIAGRPYEPSCSSR
jgi:WD40 repeat protein